MTRTGSDSITRGLRIACTLAFPALLAGCMTYPHTQLDWPGYRTSYSHSHSTRYASASATRHKSHHHYSRVARAAHPAKPTARPRYVAHSAPSPRPTEVSVASAGSRSMTFRWPVEGRILSAFGGRDGQRNDGINIAAQRGAPIHAAASGKVTYAGDELKSYGNLVLLKHDNGYVTAYAHAERIVVGRGDYVRKGQVIGYAGSTGDVRTPQVHFEIRHGVRPVDPRPLLLASS